MLRVTSEVGRLRRVLIHEPGREVDHMVPAMMEELLFDDILFGERARDEHGQFRRVLQLLGIEVVEAKELLRETLSAEGCREWLRGALGESIPSPYDQHLLDYPEEDVAEMLVSGVRRDSKSPLEVSDMFSITPIPNWCFQRDPLVILHDGVFISSMATGARLRESLLTRAMFRFHPELKSSPIFLDPFDASGQKTKQGASWMLEGGDVLVISKDIVAIGQSARTDQAAIENVARALAGREDGPRWLMVVKIPDRRAYMHLDTVFTPIDRDACLVHAGVIMPGSREEAEVAEIDLHDPDLTPMPTRDLLTALQSKGQDLKPIFCGGMDPVAQYREQWTDGANCFALSPGVIVLYDRNVRTAEELDRQGYRIVPARELLLGREEFSLESDEKACILVSSFEISRARGGPHCLSHPMIRDEL